LHGIPVVDGDLVVGDDDGVIFVPADRADDVLGAAAQIVATETAQAHRMRAGESLRAQLDFAGFLAKQAADPTMTLRRHLSEHGGAIEV